MARLYNPTGADIHDRLVASGLILSPVSGTDTLFDLDAIASAGVEAFQSRTGHIPFLRDTNDATRYYDPPGPSKQRAGFLGFGGMGGSRTLALDAGLLTLTSLTTGYSPTHAGTVQTVNEDFWLMPHNAVVRGHPYTSIEFAAAQYGERRSIVIVGKFGYSTTIPEEVFACMMDLGILSVMDNLQSAITGGSIKWKEADTEESYSDDPMGAMIRRKKYSTNKVLSRYTIARAL